MFHGCSEYFVVEARFMLFIRRWVLKIGLSFLSEVVLGLNRRVHFSHTRPLGPGIIEVILSFSMQKYVEKILESPQPADLKP